MPLPSSSKPDSGLLACRRPCLSDIVCRRHRASATALALALFTAVGCLGPRSEPPDARQTVPSSPVDASDSGTDVLDSADALTEASHSGDFSCPPEFRGCSQTYLDQSKILPNIRGTDVEFGRDEPVWRHETYEEWHRGNSYVRLTFHGNEFTIEGYGFKSWYRSMPQLPVNKRFWANMEAHGGILKGSVRPSRSSHVNAFPIKKALDFPSCRSAQDNHVVSVTVVQDYRGLNEARREWTDPSCAQFPSGLVESIWEFLPELAGVAGAGSPVRAVPAK